MIAAQHHINKGETFYRAHPFVSNSDLSKLKGGYLDPEVMRFGTLFHSVTLEYSTVDLIKGVIKGHHYQYSPAEIKLARSMRLSFLNDSLCRQLLATCAVEVEMYNADTRFYHEGRWFSLDTKRKYDLFAWAAGWGGDIKSTSATSEGEFIKDIDRYDYDRGRVFYAQGSGARQDIIVGVSKVAPYRVFKVFMKAADARWKRGTDKMNELAALHHELNPPF